MAKSIFLVLLHFMKKEAKNTIYTLLCILIYTYSFANKTPPNPFPPSPPSDVPISENLIFLAFAGILFILIKIESIPQNSKQK